MCRKLVLSAISLLFGGLLLAQPTITSFTPQSGVVGSVVTIVGTGFNTTPANNVVIFGATRATVTAAAATQLTVTVPAGATYAPITVLNTATGLMAYSRSQFIPTFTPVKNFIIEGDFNPKVDFATGSLPSAVVIGDLDGDNKSDLVVANSNGNTVSVFRNASSMGTISYAAKVDFTTGSRPYSVAMGDLDGDGRADLAVSNSNNNTISVFLNTSSIGIISFATKVDLATSSAPSGVAIGDLDGDGRADLAVANWNSHTVSVLRNTSSMGSISYATKVDFVTGSSPLSVAIGDLDGDGKADLAVANMISNTVSVLRNASSTGGITYAPKVDIGVGLDPRSVAIGDLDVDGKADLAVANWDSHTVSVLRNTSSMGSISYATKVDFATGSRPYSVAMGDLDGDGKLDLVLPSNISNTFSVLRNTSSTGNISYSARVNFATGSSPQSVCIGDLDGDGKSDLVVANYGSSTISVIRNNPTPSPPVITSFLPNSGLVGSSVTISGTGFNATLTNNLVIFGATRATVTAATATQLTVTVPTGATYAPITVLNTATGLLAYSRSKFIPTYTPAKNGITAADFHPKVDFATNSSPYSVAIGDLDGDGRADLAVADYNTNTVSVFRNTSIAATISYSVRVNFFTGANPCSVAIGDLDGDGRADLAVTNFSSNTVSVLRNIGSTGNIIYATRVDFVTGSIPSSVAIGDLDGDGKADLAVANKGSNTVSVLRNTSSTGGITYAPKVDFVTGSWPCSVAMGDLDGDGRADLAVANWDSHTVSVLRNTSSMGSISYATKVDFATGSTPYSVAMGDLDGDGMTDLAVANWNTVSVLRNTSTTGIIGYAAKVDFALNIGPSSVGIGDLDGDSRADLAVANFQSNSVSVFRNISSTGSIDYSTKVDFIGSGPLSVSIGDLDGDGKSDLAVVNQKSNTVSVLRSASNSQTIQFSPLTPRQYGGGSFSLTATATSGLPVSYTSSNSAVATISGSIVTITGAGTTVITASQPGNATWAAAVPVQQTLVVTKAPLTATASNASKVYGTANPTFSFSYSGFVNGENASVIDSPPTVGSAATNCSNVGTYPVTLSGGTDNNYTITNVNGTLTVNKANLTVTADNTSKTYNTPNPALTFSYSGFVCSDNASVIDVAPTVSTSATTTSNAGTYPITLSGGSDNNYNLNLVNGTLTINKANQTISFSPIPTLCTYATHSLVASSSSGLPITFSSSDVTKATVSGSTLTAVAHGTPTITATQAGNVNFNPASASQVVTINPNPTASISGGNAVCFGATTTLTAQPGGSGFTYVWSTGATSQTISVGSGTYTVTVYKNGCSGTSSTFVEGVDCSGGGGDPCPDPYNPNCPCTGPYCARLKGVQNNDIPDDFIDKSPGIYPNPAVTDYFILLEEPGAEATQVTMTDVSGKVVRQTQIEERMWAKKVNVADLPTGLYVVRLTQNNKSLYYRLLISR